MCTGLVVRIYQKQIRLMAYSMGVETQNHPLQHISNWESSLIVANPFVPPFGGKHMQLETSRLGQSGLEITRVGIGTAPIGSNPSWSIYWGPQNEREAIRAIDMALDLGVNWIDTAPFYGWGRAEQIVGKALQGTPHRAYLFTNCHTLPHPHGRRTQHLTPATI